MPSVPRTLSGKKLEVPVKRILTGTPPEVAAARDSLADPAALDWFVAQGGDDERRAGHRPAARRSIGAAEVDRLLPFHARRMVGPFIFADLIGPEELGPGRGADVPPHPHIGLATVTYLFDGAMVHRDSTGAVQTIEPGGVNWMTAGAGVVHSERSPDDARPVTSMLAGLQTWVALPDEVRGGRAVVPARRRRRAARPSATAASSVRLLVGTAFGAASPVPGASPLFHADVHLDAGTRFALPPEHAERAVLVVDGDVEVAGERDPAAAPRRGRRRRRRRAGVDGGARRHVRRRPGRPAPHLVELRLVEPGPHRGGQGRLGGPPLRPGPRRDRARRAPRRFLVESEDRSASPSIVRSSAAGTEPGGVPAATASWVAAGAGR